MNTLEQLNRPGWEAAYEAVYRAVNAVASAGRDRLLIPNFILLGNPGTGKTSIGMLIGQILREEGILKSGHTVMVSECQLTSTYVAGVPKATMEQVDKAEEGVLFIDEAHALGRRDGGANHSDTGVEVT